MKGSRSNGRGRRGLALLTALALLLAACGGSATEETEAPAATDATTATEAPSDTEAPQTTSGPATTEATMDSMCEPSDEPVTLEYWTWGTGYSDAVDIWNANNPNIQVNFSDIPVGNDGGYQKMFTAITSGDAPDVGFIEFDTVASFAVTGALVDVVPYLGADAVADFLPGFVEQVAIGGAGTMYNVPLGGGPMAMFYRADLFEANGIDVPTTWDEFRTAAEQVRAADPDAYMVNFDGAGNANWFAGLASQNGAQWFSLEDDTWTVTIDGPETLEVADFWQGLLEDDLSSQLPTFSPEWTTALAAGQIWTWPSAVWGAGAFPAIAPDDAGLWAVAPLPVWGPDKPASGSWGGGGLSVFESSEHPCEAAQFALWMGTSEEAMVVLNQGVGIYPTTNELLENEIFTAPNPYYGDQRVFDVFLEASEGLAEFTWGPVMGDTYAAVTDGFSDALGNPDVTLGETLPGAESATVDAMERQGFQVTR